MYELYVIGLGKGDENSLRILEEERFSGVSTCIFHTAPLYLKELVEKKGLRFISMEDVVKIKQGCSLKNLCRETVRLVLESAAEDGTVALFLPGRPWPGEAILNELSVQLGGKNGLLHMVSGEDIWGYVMDFLGREMLADFSRGVTFFDAYSLEQLRDPPRGQLFITHPCSKELLSNIRRRLLNFYPPEHNVNILQFNSRGSLFLLEVRPLGKIEETGAFNCWTFLHLTPSPSYSFGDMACLMEQLRSPEGCPWDRQQDHFSLRPYVLEEAYEVVGAINRGIPHELCEELGDLLLQVIFHSQLAGERGDFSLWQVIDGITTKIYRRHPHVFQNEKAADAAEVRLKWQEIKQLEKGKEKAERFAMPAELPALMKAQKVQKRAADVGFDWPEISGAVEKVYEELRELTEAYITGHRPKIEEEVGDLFFALVNIARFLGVEAEIALQFTIDKFIHRFKYIEDQVQLRGGDYSAFSLAELDRWWEEAKKQEKK
ncbi:MAG: nucleoside triphosphate pyrophosphohydrolase [Dethiobacter sp.]|jgi:tetrapyrrole methylase family protein/MazG family protein|nr:MAG: nucleoside triphosphate pyrophosphohydrolase [Dethiobacter sp.]